MKLLFINFLLHVLYDKFLKKPVIANRKFTTHHSKLFKYLSNIFRPEKLLKHTLSKVSFKLLITVYQGHIIYDLNLNLLAILNFRQLYYFLYTVNMIDFQEDAFLLHTVIKKK